MKHPLARAGYRAGAIVVIGALLLFKAHQANAIIPCQVAVFPWVSPAHPSPADLISVYAFAWVYFTPSIIPPGTVFVARTTNPSDARYAVDVVLTAHPENFTGYTVITLPVDSAVAKLGPLPVGSYSLQVTVRLGDDPATAMPNCGSPTRMQFSVGSVAGATSTAPTVEFYNRTLDHYFITQDAKEIADLDGGVHAGWQRTGESFLAYGPECPTVAASPRSGSTGYLRPG